MAVIRILGTRGVPASHGGFETFAEHLALFLVAHGWKVIVYCQEDGEGPIFEDSWEGVDRIRVPVSQAGPKGTVIFDWKCTVHASRHSDLCLVLGYNTAVFMALLRLKGVTSLINMDGIEWARAKWGGIAKAWFYVNDWAGCWLGHHLIADHPQIKRHLTTRVSGNKITTIPYGADMVADAPVVPLTALGLEPRRFLTVIARPEPENSILEIVKAFSRNTRGCTLAVLGNYSKTNAYHRAVQEVAGPEVRFLGAIYDKKVVQALRFHSLAYVHGHQVGGTNPSLVEALGAGNAVIAHDNPYNRWVVGESGAYFGSEKQCAEVFDVLLTDEARLNDMRSESRKRHGTAFTWEGTLSQYESLLALWLEK